MIKINLLGEDTSIDNSGIFQVAMFGASVGLFCIIFFLLNGAIRGEVETLEREKVGLETRLASLKKTTAEVRELESKRTDLRMKLAVIAKLKKSRSGPVRVLDDLNMSLPEKSWLLSVKEKTAIARIDGMALDNQTIASFMNELEKSDYFTRVDLVEAHGVQWQGVAMKQFTLSTTVTYAGKIAEEEAKKEETKGEKSKGKKVKPTKEDEV
jgi:type IV pilus assembly protein PilN